MVRPETYGPYHVATGRASLARQVKGEHPDKERYTAPPGWSLGRWASTPSPGGGNTCYKNLDKGLDGRRKITQTSIEVDAETKESMSKTEEKLDGRYKEGNERKKPK